MSEGYVKSFSLIGLSDISIKLYDVSNMLCVIINKLCIVSNNLRGIGHLIKLR